MGANIDDSQILCTGYTTCEINVVAAKGYSKETLDIIFLDDQTAFMFYVNYDYYLPTG